MRARLIGCLLAAASLPAAYAAKAPTPNVLPAKPVSDLHYGDVLFNFYAGHDFEALTRLNAYQQWGRMPSHASDAALLAGGLYLTMGLHNEAGARFEQLLTADVPVGVRNRAWFYLGKIWYTRGYYDRAEQSLDRIVGLLSPQLEAQRQHLYVNVLMREAKFDEAAARLRNWSGPADWMAFARFNLGVALIRQNRIGDAEPILTAVGTLSTEDEELLALKDKANLALGFAWLQANNAASARTALNRVRLSGPYATRALLGVGWASSTLGDFRGALNPWLELHDRNLLDPAVQESYLAVPYAFGKLNANAQAAQYYETAISAFGAESTRIDEAVERIGTGHLLDDLLGDDDRAQPSWYWQLKALPDSPQSRYLYALLADNDFQEGLKNYRDLEYFDGTLARWGENMDAFAAMIDARERAYAQRLPVTDKLLASGRTGQLLGARTDVDARLNAVETGADTVALGTPQERAQWARVRALEQALASAPSGPETDAARDKLRLIKGTLLWKLDQGFKQRDFAARTTLREIDAALNEAQNRWARLQKARNSVPTNTGEFAARVAALGERLTALSGGLKQAEERQDRFLTRMAQTELLQQKDRLGAYQVQARFALADIYDRAVNPGAEARPPAAPATPETPATPAGPAEPPP